MSGLIPRGGLPLEDLTDLVRLALADGHLERVAEGNQPALAAEGAHFVDVIDADQGVAVDALETGVGEAGFYGEASGWRGSAGGR